MLKKICKSLGVLATAGLLLLQGVGIAEAGVLKTGRHIGLCRCPDREKLSNH